MMLCLRRNDMSSFSKLNVLKCPYCGELLSSHRDLRAHVGVAHRGRTDHFTEEFFGGRTIEVDFVTLMLQRAMSDLTPEFCDRCNGCSAVCPISLAVEGFTPRQMVSRVQG